MPGLEPVLVQSVFQTVSLGMLITDSDPKIVAINPAFTRITGWTEADILGKNPKVLQSGQQSQQFYEAMWSSLLEYGHWSGEVIDRRKDGAFYHEWLTIDAIKGSDDQTEFYIGVFADVTSKKQEEEKLRFLAYHDPLTGLANRTLFDERLTQALALVGRSGKVVAVKAIDLDGFKDVNDTYGHDAGDQLLLEAGARIDEQTRKIDTVARVGGDEFFVLCQEVEGERGAVRVAERILGALSQPFSLNGVTVTIGASIGVKLCRSDAEEVGAIIKRADEALYMAKKEGKGVFRLVA